LTEFALARLLPVAPRPETDERLSSWLARLAAIYGSPVGALLAHCGLAGADPFVLEKGLGAGEGALLAERTGLSPEKIEAMTFREVAAPARFMIARGDRGICPRCAETPAIRRRDAALPWGFWCAVHGRRRRPLSPGETAVLDHHSEFLHAAAMPAKARDGKRIQHFVGQDDAVERFLRWLVEPLHTAQQVRQVLLQVPALTLAQVRADLEDPISVG